MNNFLKTKIGSQRQIQTKIISENTWISEKKYKLNRFEKKNFEIWKKKADVSTYIFDQKGQQWKASHEYSQKSFEIIFEPKKGIYKKNT